MAHTSMSHGTYINESWHVKQSLIARLFVTKSQTRYLLLIVTNTVINAVINAIVNTVVNTVVNPGLNAL